MTKLKAADVEVFRPEKSLFATKANSVIEEFKKDPAMKTIVEKIQAQ